MAFWLVWSEAAPSSSPSLGRAYLRSFFAFFERVWFVSSRAAALDVVLGRSPRPESLMDRKEAKRAKATRLAAVDVVSESGIPVDRGSFGA